ncbi:unnamed protein product [Boreogadus saida]
MGNTSPLLVSVLPTCHRREIHLPHLTMLTMMRPRPHNNFPLFNTLCVFHNNFPLSHHIPFFHNNVNIRTPQHNNPPRLAAEGASPRQRSALRQTASCSAEAVVPRQREAGLKRSQGEICAARRSDAGAHIERTRAITEMQSTRRSKTAEGTSGPRTHQSGECDRVGKTRNSVLWDVKDEYRNERGNSR